MKSTRHEITIILRFNKKCTKSQALVAARDCVHGEFYPYTKYDMEGKATGPEKFKISGYKHARKAIK